jgi:glycosyltransferase involved in cell wall biosynthesis
VSVIIPAHNEAAVIERCLRSLEAGARRRPVQIVVVCNGCSDDTAAIARRVLPEAIVVDSPVPSKHGALNLGDDLADHFPRFYVDADVTVSPGALDLVADLLSRGDVMAAAPRPLFDLSRSSRAARLFLELWQHAPYFTQDLVGSGFYALSEDGRRRFDRFPPVIADDYFIASSFSSGERRGVDGCTFTPLLPVTLRGVVNIHIRHYAAHRELATWLSAMAAEAPDVQLQAPTDGSWLRPFARRPGWWPNILAYLVVKVLARAGGLYKHRYGRMTWNRDQAGRDSVGP